MGKVKFSPFFINAVIPRRQVAVNFMRTICLINGRELA